MSDQKWRVTGPGGFERDVVLTKDDVHDESVALVAGTTGIRYVDLLRIAGYRAEPIEEPKMVTVRAEDLATAIDAGKKAVTGLLAHEVDALLRLRAALDGAK